MMLATRPKPEGKPLGPPPAGPENGLQRSDIPPMTPEEAERFARLWRQECDRLEREERARKR